MVAKRKPKRFNYAKNTKDTLPRASRRRIAKSNQKAKRGVSGHGALDIR